LGEWYDGGWLKATFLGGGACVDYPIVGNWYLYGNIGYIVFCNNNNNNPVYGWIEIKVSDSWGFQILGYGIEDKEITNIIYNNLEDLETEYNNDCLTISYNKYPLIISMVDLNGRIVLQRTITSESNFYTDGLSSGLYIVHISNDNNTKTIKIVK
jgi:hypothetical protein